MTTPRVLFVCKQRPATYGASYGLLNSCRFLSNAINKLGGHAKLVEVLDNNFIDREVHKYKPTHVFIEAIWVVPEKFKVLIPLHPDVNWYVRLHSNTPFLSGEGVAIDWIKKYHELSKTYEKFKIAPNSFDMMHELNLIGINSTVYTPNIYCPDESDNQHINYKSSDKDNSIINIGCFGAIRPLKNQLIQAMAAMRFAELKNKKLKFHINHTRIEGHGENVHKNLKALFHDTEHELIEHGWVLHDEFIKLVREMDLGLQVSFSETFNIVAADFAHSGVPCVGSSEIKWMSCLYKANPTNIDSILFHMKLAWFGKRFNFHKLNKWGLQWYNYKSMKVWRKFLNLP